MLYSSRLLLGLGALVVCVACESREGPEVLSAPTAAERLLDGCCVPPWDSALAEASAQVPSDAGDAWVDAVLSSTRLGVHDPAHCEERARHAQVLARADARGRDDWARALEVLGDTRDTEGAHFAELEAFLALQPHATAVPSALVACLHAVPAAMRVRVSRAASEILGHSGRVLNLADLRDVLQQLLALPQAEAGSVLVAATSDVARRWAVPVPDVLAILASCDATYLDVIRTHPPCDDADAYDSMDAYLAWIEQAHKRALAGALWAAQPLPAVFSLEEAYNFVTFDQGRQPPIDAPALSALAHVAHNLGHRKSAALYAVAPLHRDDRLAVLRILALLDHTVTADNMAIVARILSLIAPDEREVIAVLVKKIHVDCDVAAQHVGHIPTWLAMLGQLESAARRAALVVALGYVGVDANTPTYVLPTLAQGLMEMPQARRGHFLHAAKRLMHVGMAAHEKVAIFQMLGDVQTRDLDAFVHRAIVHNGGDADHLQALAIERAHQDWVQHGPRRWAHAVYLPQDVHQAALVARVAEQIRVLQRAYPNPPDTPKQLARMEAFIRDKARTTPRDNVAFVRRALHGHNVFEAAQMALRGPGLGGDFPPIASNEPYPGTSGVADLAALFWHAVENYPQHTQSLSHHSHTMALEKENLQTAFVGALASIVGDSGIACYEGKVQRMLQALEGYFFAGPTLAEDPSAQALLRLHGQAFAQSVAARAAWRTQVCGQSAEQAEGPTQADLLALVGALQAEFEAAWPSPDGPEQQAGYHALRQWLAVDYEGFVDVFDACWQTGSW